MTSLYRIERAGPKATQPYLVQFYGSTRRFLTKESAAYAIASVLATADQRVEDARQRLNDVVFEVTEEHLKAVLAENEDVT